MARDLSLTTRAEEVRDSVRIAPPVHFSVEEIKNHFIESMDTVKAQFDVADNLMSNANEDGCNTIWRSQVVLAEGLLDFYIHEISKYCMFQMFCGNWDKSEKYALFMVPMARVEEAIAATESNEWFFDFLNKRFSRDVFLSVESMRDQLNLIGVGYVATMGKAFPRGKAQDSTKDGSKIVEELFNRRNKIAHQNDRSHESAEQTPISKEFVEEYIGNIERIVNAIHDIVVSKDTVEE